LTGAAGRHFRRLLSPIAAADFLRLDGAAQTSFCGKVFLGFFY